MKQLVTLVSVVDDDESIRESLPDLLREFGFKCKTFATAEEFIGSRYVEKTKCLILDITMPGMSGPELRRELIKRGHDIPTIFITANTDAVSRPDILEGASACLLKPFSDVDLLAALRNALKSAKSD